MKKITDIFEGFEKSSDDITAELAQCCEPLTWAEEKRIFDLMESKYKSRKIVDSGADQVEGVEIYKRPAWYKRLSQAAAVVVLISGIAVGAVLIGGFSKSETVMENYSSENSKAHIVSDEEQTLRAPFSFFPADIVESGEMTATVQTAEWFDNLNDAGIAYEDLMSYQLYDSESQSFLTYDEKTGKMPGNWRIIKLHIIVDNISAVTSWKNMGYRYADDQYEFQSSLCGSIKYAVEGSYSLRDCHQKIYYSLKGECKSDSNKFLCKPGISKEYDIAYIVNAPADKIYFGSGNGKYSRLELEGECS